MLAVIFWIIIILVALVLIYAAIHSPLSDKNKDDSQQSVPYDKYRADNFQYQDPEDDSIEDRMRRDESDAEQMRENE